MLTCYFRFSVYLQSGSQYEPYDIGLCVDARFNYGNDRNTVVRVSKQSGSWGDEEKGISYFPFTPNMNFDMIIMVENHAYKVVRQNAGVTDHYTSFAHHSIPFSLLHLIAYGFCMFHLTLKVPNKNCSRRHFNFLLLSFEENKA